MNDRVPVTKERRKELHEFALGLGTTYDEAIGFLLKFVRKPDETPLSAGDRLRPQFNSALDRQNDSDDED
jgi:hypothetical protein